MTDSKLQPWEVVESQDRLTLTPWLKVRTESVRLPTGQVVDNFVQIEQPSFVCIYPEISDGRVICLRQYRHGPRQVCLTFPGGHIDHPDEPPLVCAERELLEETGYRASAWIYLGRYVVNANAGGAVSHMFRATGCYQVAEANSGDLEETRLELLTQTEILAAVAQGEMPIITQIALLGMAVNPVLSAAAAGSGHP